MISGSERGCSPCWFGRLFVMHSDIGIARSYGRGLNCDQVLVPLDGPIFLALPPALESVLGDHAHKWGTVSVTSSSPMAVCQHRYLQHVGLLCGGLNPCVFARAGRWCVTPSPKGL